MASIRERKRKDGSLYYSVRFTLADGTETSDSYNTRPAADKVKALVDSVGGDQALKLLGITRTDQRATRLKGMTVEQWLTHYVDHLTGVDQGTLDRYRAYIRNDLGPELGPIAMASLTEEDLARWLLWMETAGALNRDGSRRPASAKTIRNKHGFLYGAFAAAVPAHLDFNPATGHRLPQGEAREADEENVFLSHQEFATLRGSLTEYWRPLGEFLVASGCRWGEATALRPTDVDRQAGTVRIRRAWSYSTTKGYWLNKPKGKSLRTINVPSATLSKLDYANEWLFINRRGGPVRGASFHANVWTPAVERAGLMPAPRVHDLRHTCASWMIAAKVPLPVIQRHLGHESITTTIKVYGHLDRASYQDAAAVIGGILEGF